MDTLLQANIFFFITTIAVAIVTIALGVALFYAIQILRDARYVSRRVREQSDRLLSDMEDLRGFIKREGKRAISMKELVSGIMKTFSSKKESPRARRTKKES